LIISDIDAAASEQDYPIRIQIEESETNEDPSLIAASAKTGDKHGNRYDNVFTNLRLLAAFENILAELRSDLIKNLYRASDLEEKEGEGASNVMIHDADFFNLLVTVSKKLMTEVIELPRRFEDSYLNLTIYIIGNINMLLEKSKWYKSKLALGDQLAQ
jgi:hypothetical protein